MNSMPLKGMASFILQYFWFFSLTFIKPEKSYFSALVLVKTTEFDKTSAVVNSFDIPSTKNRDIPKSSNREVEIEFSFSSNTRLPMLNTSSRASTPL